MNDGEQSGKVVMMMENYDFLVKLKRGGMMKDGRRWKIRKRSLSEILFYFLFCLTIVDN